MIGRDRTNRFWIGRRLGNGVMVDRVDSVDRMNGMKGADDSRAGGPCDVMKD